MASRIKWCDRELDQGISPNVSVSKEILRNEEGDSFGQKFTIGIDGYVIATGDPINGARQNSLYEKINKFLGLSPQGSTSQQGTLEILPIDGGSSSSGVLRFDNTQLISLNLPESPEDTAGIQYQQYTFAFESYQPINSLDIFSGYRIKSTNESWEIQRDNENISYTNDDLFTSDPKYTYTLTHTISAVGIQNYSGGQIVSTAYNEAYKYVQSRLKEDITTPISKNSYNQNYSTAINQYNLSLWKPTQGNIGSDVANLTEYSAYNKVRTATMDTAGGSYSATTTYQLSPSSGTYEVNVKYDEGEEGDVTISIEGNITPFSTGVVASPSHSKSAVASGLFTKISNSGTWTSFKTLAEQALSYYKGYTNACAAGLGIDPRPRSISIGQNKNNGVITFNLTYKGISTEILNLKNRVSGAISVLLVVTDDNPLITGVYKNAFQFNKVAVIDILGKSNGPVIQDMGTTKERKRTIQLDVVMKQGCRTANGSPASSCYPMVLEKKPPGINVYSQGFSEMWNWMEGKYSLTLDWIYT